MLTTPQAPEAADALQAAPPPPDSFGEAFWFWFKLGFVSFAGPAGQIAIMHEELVEKRRWISERRFLHALNYCMVLPGPEAQQLATYIGWLMHRTLGGVVAGGLFVLPSLFILIALSWIYVAFGNIPLVAGTLYGIKPAVTAIVLFTAYRIGSRALKNAMLLGIAAAAFVSIFVLDLPFPLIVLGTAAMGWFGERVPRPNSRLAASTGRQKKVSGQPSLMTTRLRPRMRVSVGRVSHACSLWGLCSGVVCLRSSWRSTAGVER
jgi:chromate transporter